MELDFTENYPRRSCRDLYSIFGLKKRGRTGIMNENNIDECKKRRKIDVYSSSDFFTYRLEHRTQGLNEERILLFRSDRPAVVAKIIFSSFPAPSMSRDIECNGCDEQDEKELSRMAQAKIDVLEVKEPYRGRDFGGLLFTEAVSALRNRYNCDMFDVSDDSSLASVRCQLDAEEDLNKYNRLVNFYQELGCHVKPRAKVRFLNNNDGETYRSVPMQIALRHPAARCRFVDYKDNEKNELKETKAPWSSLVNQTERFLPIHLLDYLGGKLLLQNHGISLTGGKMEWLLVEGKKGFMFRSTHGLHLLTCPDGKVIAITDSDNQPFQSIIPQDWEIFKCFNIPDYDVNDVSQCMNDEYRRENELWLFETCHGTYLTTLKNNETDTFYLTSSKFPTFWKADANTLKFTCTRDTPRRREYHKLSWATQNVKYVMEMRNHYTKHFKLGKMNIIEALNFAKEIPASCFRVTSEGVSLRTFLFHMAEGARKSGLPDWMQFIALIHELGRVVKLMKSSPQGSYDWTFSSFSRVVGCIPNQSIPFQEFSFLDTDKQDSRYNTNLGIYEENCGLDSLLLSWTGQEYLYFMLKGNNVTLPSEAFSILRYFSLVDWHSHNQNACFQNFDDIQVKQDVFDFYNFREVIKSKILGGKLSELSDSECDELWNRHYSMISKKYICDVSLNW